jgi:hypothetical protein
MIMAEGQVYDIPEAGLDWLKGKVAKLSKKIEKLGGEKLYLTVVGFHFEGETAKRKMWEVFLAVPEIKLAGWEFMARLDHTDEGTILRKLTTEELPTRYRDASPVCDHCQFKRRRRDTFVVRHCETGEFKQVGSSCLKDFLGHESADKLAKIAEIVSNMSSVIQYARGFSSLNNRYIDVQAYCEEAAVCILGSGWVSKARAKQEGCISTAEKANNAMHWRHGVSDEAATLAKNALEWAAHLEGELSDYEHNIKVIASTDCMEERSTGIAASIVGVYWVRQQKSYVFESTFQGRVGETITRDVTLRQVQSLQNSTRFQFTDDDGNVYTWFASSDVLRARKDQTFKISGVVKDHVVFRDVKQTLINRVTALD